MTDALIGELYRRYMRGELTLEETAEQIYALARDGQTGLSVFTGEMSAEDQERTYALLGRMQWHAMREAMPSADIPPITGQQFLKFMDELKDVKETD